MSQKVSDNPDNSGTPASHMDPTATEKQQLRSRLLAARQAHGGRSEAAAAVVGRLHRLPELAVAAVVSGYAATRSEVDISPVLSDLLARKVTVCLPWVDGARLRLSVVRDLEADLAPGWRGVREPRPAIREPLTPTAVDVMLVPGLAFDAAGHRLGYGGGHFDRLLGRLRPGTPLVGVAFATQVVAQLPAASHDVPVSAVVTEEGVHRPRA